MAPPTQPFFAPCLMISWAYCKISLFLNDYKAIASCGFAQSFFSTLKQDGREERGRFFTGQQKVD